MEFYADASAGPFSTQGDSLAPNVSRPLADYHSDLWGNHFLANTSDSDLMVQKKQLIENLKEKVRRELHASANKPSQQLQLIDAIQRLGIAYHFEVEIEAALQHLYDTHNNWLDRTDISCAALCFRLLRQQGFNISCEIFNRFKDEKGDFKDSLVADVHGLLSLYEAAYVSVHGEYTLDLALGFTTTHLKSIASHLGNDTHAKQVRHALNRPLRKGTPRLEVWHYISFYQEDASHNETVLKLAKLDFSLVQSLRREELSEITRWWKGLDFATKLPFVRDRLTECYFWASEICVEPQYYLSRKLLCQIISMMTVIDDIYDAYGTYEELEIFTEAVDRWNIDSLYKLPEYMKVCYQALLDLYEEIEKEMAKKGALYRVYYAKESMKAATRGYIAEAKWLREGYVPTMEEYMNVALMTAGSSALIITSAIDLGDIVTKECLDWWFTQPKVFRALTTISRFMDDMGSHKFEQRRKHIPSAVECYIHQNNVSEQEALEAICKLVEDAWKDINEEFLRPTVLPVPMLVQVLNFARTADLLYKDGDIFTHSGKQMKDHIKALMVDPISE